MSEDWSKLRDVDLLADGRVRLDFTIPLAEFPRLQSLLARAEGAIAGHASFDRERSLPAAEVEVAGHVPLTCQRCLEPFDFAVDSRGRVVLVADAAEADRAPEDLETILAPGHRISLRELAEEELLLALPLAPMHAADTCAAARETRLDRAAARMPERTAQRTDPDAAPAEDRHRPFERLDELLRRGK